MIKHLDSGYIEIYCDKCNDELCDSEVIYIRKNIHADYCEDCYIEYKEKKGSKISDNKEFNNKYYESFDWFWDEK